MIPNFHFGSSHLRGITISLTIPGVNDLLGIPIKLLLNKHIDLELILGNRAKLLIEQLEEAQDEIKMIK